jgi:type III restriction enzyme
MADALIENPILNTPFAAPARHFNYVDFDTTRPVHVTRADKCHVSHVVADTDSWEQKMAQTLEDTTEVIRYVKNHNPGFTIPYTINGEEHQYHPDFVAVLDDGSSPLDPLNLIKVGQALA